MRVRAFASEDRNALERIYLDSRAEATWLPDAVKGKADFLRDTKGEILFVAVGDEGEPRGFVSVWEPKAFIHHLYVRADSRGIGIGVMLLDHLCDRLPMPWQLKCVRNNANAIAFYSRRGWIEVGAGSGEEGPFALMEMRPAK